MIQILFGILTGKFCFTGSFMDKSWLVRPEFQIAKPPVRNVDTVKFLPPKSSFIDGIL